MIDVCFNSYIFLRTPTLSYNDHNSEPERIIKLHSFQLAIFFASESLYMELMRHDFNYHLLDKKVKFSLQKYLNRMCYRPTPFGMFSAFTSLDWCKTEDSKAGILLEDNYLYVSPDFQLLIDLAREIESLDTIHNLKYYSNNSIYSIKNEKRYLTYNYDTKEERNVFLISSYKSDRLLNKIITFCKNGKTRIQLTNWLNELIGSNEGVKDYIDDLIDVGLLISELSPNMSGKKYFERITDIIFESPNKHLFFNSILKYKYVIENIKHENDVNIKNLIESSEFITYRRALKSKFYVGYEKKTNSSLNLKYQQYIKEGLNCLDKLALDTNSKPLTNFKNRFTARFEDQEIPLLVALDREAGIGYDGLESNLISSGLLNGIHLDIQPNNLNFSWTPIHEFFLSKLSKAKDDQTIIISDKELEKLDRKSELKTPPSFSVIFRTCGSKIWIEQAGGCTAAALLGRFTQFNAEILTKSRKIDLQESELNKDVIFVEISCFNDEHSANINSNAGIRQYEIPIGVHSTLNRSNIINLSDITVSVINNQIVIRSKKLNKIIIPRLSSAYNYTRSDLSIYRFLCDLQYQGLKSNYSIDLKTLLPGLNFYPRIEYKNCILFPATWILNTDEIAELKKEFENTAERNILYKSLRLKKHFALTEGDNQLYFDCDDHKSVLMFMKVISNKSSIILQEVFLDPAELVKNIDHQPLCGQFITAVINNSVTYNQITIDPLSVKKSKTKRTYLPGDEWLYFKLYSHPSISNNILLKKVSKIIGGLRKQNTLKCWYFIRYTDTDTHLRVRMRINKNNTSEVMQYFEKNIRNDFEKGRINNLLLDTYKREIERYGAYTIEYVERIFEASSDLIINFLKKKSKTQSSYSELHLALFTANIILEVFLKSPTEYISLLKLIHESMKHEFEDSRSVTFQLNNKYREYAAFIDNMNTNTTSVVIVRKKELNNYIKVLNLLKTKANAFSDEKLNKMVADLLHMHLNRVFTENHRKQEFIIYYLLYKHHLSLKARKTKAASLLSGAPQSFGVNHINKTILK